MHLVSACLARRFAIVLTGMIALVSSAGLANRLRALDSSILLARATGHSLAVWWPRNQACGARFSDLFEPIPGVGVGAGYPRLVSIIASRFGLALSGRIRHTLPIEAVSRASLVSINTIHSFISPEDFSWAKPVAGIASEIERVGRADIGIHIRRGDHPTATRSNPTAGFMRAMHGRPEATFFLATDDDSVRRQVVDAFPGRVTTVGRMPSRTTIEGVQDAVVDLFCLANCSEIWASRGSSFGEVAHYLRRAPLHFPAAV